MGSKKPKNPCIDVCKIDRDTGLCRGCLRTREEIRGWKSMSRPEREQVLEAIELRRQPAEAAAAPAAPAGPASVGGAPDGPAIGAARRWRHRATGGLYEELHRALMERDQMPVVVYRGEDGRVWVRPAAQFDDGRFEAA